MNKRVRISIDSLAGDESPPCADAPRRARDGVEAGGGIAAGVGIEERLGPARRTTTGTA